MTYWFNISFTLYKACMEILNIFRIIFNNNKCIYKHYSDFKLLGTGVSIGKILPPCLFIGKHCKITHVAWKKNKEDLKLIIRYPLRSILQWFDHYMGTSILLMTFFLPTAKQMKTKTAMINMNKICFLHCLRENFNNCLSMCQKQILCQLVRVTLSSIVFISDH